MCQITCEQGERSCLSNNPQTQSSHTAQVITQQHWQDEMGMKQWLQQGAEECSSDATEGRCFTNLFKIGYLLGVPTYTQCLPLEQHQPRMLRHLETSEPRSSEPFFYDTLLFWPETDRNNTAPSLCDLGLSYSWPFFAPAPGPPLFGPALVFSSLS